MQEINEYLFIRDSRLSVEDKMRYLRPIEGRCASIGIRSMQYFLSVIDLEKHMDIALRISTNLMLDNIFTSLFIPLEKMVKYIDEGPGEVRKNICTPILYYVYARYFNKDKLDDLGIICEDFFLDEDVQLPSKMNIYSYDQKLVTYFLRYVCNLKTMDVACIGNNQLERDKERVEILNVLSQIDADNIKEYENEIREITQKLMINSELKTIEENRIHVNVDGMRSTLDQKYKNDFLRYRYHQEGRIQFVTFFRDGEAGSNINMIQNTPERILNELIFHIRDAFVSSDEYGLNGYLSLNIRHGTLEDELRSPLYKSFLTAKKDIKTGEYTINDYWEQYADESDLDTMRRAITEFYLDTEKIVNKLKKEYIQICTEEKKTKGFFDYRLHEMDILAISLEVQEINDFQEFVDVVISHLWEITERNLEAIKKVIRSEIQENYNNAFDQLRENIQKVNNKNKLRELQKKINEAATDMPNVLDRICYWFQRSTESKHSDFDMNFAFKLGLKTITNMHPERRFVARELEPTESDKISGKYLKSFDGIFYNLFDNIYKKARQNDGEIEIRYKLSHSEKKGTYIYIENDYDCSKDINEEISRVEEAQTLIQSNNYLERAKGEGGTGIPKICKIIRYDMGFVPSMDFGYMKEKNIFYMEIKF